MPAVSFCHARTLVFVCFSDSQYQLHLDDGQIITVDPFCFRSIQTEELSWSKLFSSVIFRLMLAAVFYRHFQLCLVA